MRNNVICVISLDFEPRWGARDQAFVLDLRGNLHGLAKAQTKSSESLATAQGIWRRRDLIS